MIGPRESPTKRFQGRENTVTPSGEANALQETVEAQALQILALTDETLTLQEQIAELNTRLDALAESIPDANLGGI